MQNDFIVQRERELSAVRLPTDRLRILTGIELADDISIVVDDSPLVAEAGHGQLVRIPLDVEHGIDRTATALNSSSGGSKNPKRVVIAGAGRLPLAFLKSGIVGLGCCFAA